MKNDAGNNIETTEAAEVNQESRKAPGKPFWRILKWIGIGLGSVLLLVVLALCGITWYLSSGNLTRLINKYAGEYLRADIRVRQADFTLWSSFPHFRIEADGITVVSRTLQGVSPEIRRVLPADADSLASADKLKGGLNLLSLLAGRISLRDVELTGLSLNLVAYNDSINNYNIIPPSNDTTLRVPYFEANTVRLTRNGALKYYSAATSTGAVVRLKDLSIKKIDSRSNAYEMTLDGTFSADVDRLRLFRHFPFNLKGEVRLAFSPFRIHFRDYSIALGAIRSRLNLEMNAEQGSISTMTYHVDPVSLLKLMNYVPKQFLPDIEGIRSDMTIEIGARLTAPYRYSSETLPSFEIDFAVPDSQVAYSVGGQSAYTLSHVSMEANLRFNGHDPAKSVLRLDRLDAAGEGGRLSVTGTVTDLTGDPYIRTRAEGAIDCSALAASLPALAGSKMSGAVSLDTDVSFRLSDITDGTLAEVKARGDINLKDFSYSNKSLGINMAGRTAHLSFNDDPDLRDGSQLPVDVDFSLSDLQFAAAGFNYSLKDVNVEAGTPLARLAQAIAGTSPYNVAAKVKARRAEAKEQNGSTRIYARSVDIDGQVEAGSSLRNLVLSIAADTLSVKHDEINATVRGLAGRWRMRPNPGKKRASDLKGISRFVNDWRVYGELKVTDGRMVPALYPAPVLLQALDADFSLDSLHISDLRARTGDNALRMNGAVVNLRQIFSGGVRTPVKVRLNATIDTININQIARIYEKGALEARRRESRAVGLPEPKALVHPENLPSDTVPLLLPRNIDATVNVNIAQTQYKDLRIFNMGTALQMADGVLHIDSLYMSTGFGSAWMDLDYDTRRLDSIAVSLDFDVTRINVVRFFTNFKNLLAMMPQMSNLSGNVSARISGSMLMFPNNYIDMPSLQAEIAARGWDLKVHQDPFIRRITRMLLIESGDDIDIPAIEARASVHDDLLQLYPFDLEFDRYKLQMMGVNDFAGHLYYHLGVLRSPVPFRFGVNIRGLFSNPKLRFGGPKYNVERAQKEMTINYHQNINVMKELRHYLNEFVHSAATSEVQPSPFSKPEAPASEPDN